MRKLFTVIVLLLFSAYPIFAQTIVGTDPENKNVVLEEFTGFLCPNCPSGHAIAQAIYNAHPDDVVLINIHTGYYATPQTEYQPDYRTSWGNAIAGQSGLLGYPAGTVNRHLFPGYSQGSGTAQSRGTWTTTSNMILAEPSYLNVALEATIVTSTRQLVVYVEVYYTDDSPVETNFLNVAILQNNIKGPQSGGNQGNNYNHMHMLRHLLTDQWGVEISQTSEGSLYTGTFTYEMPDDYKDVELVLEDIDIVAFVTETHQELISGNMAEITMIESYDYDAAIFSAYVPQTACTGELAPKIVIKNYGSEDLTSLDIVYTANAEDPATYEWTGDLKQNESEIVELPALMYGVTDNNEFIISCEHPNGQVDQLPQNDTYATISSGSQTYPEECYFGVQPLGNPQDITWNIADEEGEILAEGGPYDTDGFRLAQFAFPQSGCYTLTLNDASGNGLSGGFFVILDMGTNILWTGEPFTYMAVAEFAYDITIDVPEVALMNNFSIYPNPVIHTANIEFTLSKEMSVKAGVFDMLGRNVLNLYQGEMTMGKQQLSMDASGLDKGIYIIKLQLDNQVYSQKISLK